MSTIVMGGFFEFFEFFEWKKRHYFHIRQPKIALSCRAQPRAIQFGYGEVYTLVRVTHPSRIVWLASFETNFVRYTYISPEVN